MGMRREGFSCHAAVCLNHGHVFLPAPLTVKALPGASSTTSSDQWCRWCSILAHHRGLGFEQTRQTTAHRAIFMLLIAATVWRLTHSHTVDLLSSIWLKQHVLTKPFANGICLGKMNSHSSNYSSLPVSTFASSYSNIRKHNVVRLAGSWRKPMIIQTWFRHIVLSFPAVTYEDSIFHVRQPWRLNQIVYGNHMDLPQLIKTTPSGPDYVSVCV